MAITNDRVASSKGKSVQLDQLNVAVVEDNGVARLNLRNNLMKLGFTDIGCYSHGRELKPVLKKRQFHLLLVDYHLGMHKNGVEIVHELQKEGLLKPSTSVIFVTSDRFPVIVGQIFDVHPDALILKPYSLGSLEKHIVASMKFNAFIRPVLVLMDKNEFEQALETIEDLIKRNATNKYYTSLIKLKARILIKLGDYKNSADIYKHVLKSSDKVIWAKWGLIQCTHLSGRVHEAENMLENMLSTQLTAYKACEWLTRINIDKKDYLKAQDYIDMIKEGELSLSAARLKAYLYQVQDKMEEAIHLLEKKRESNRNIRERFNELSLDLARCYMSVAESKAPNERGQELKLARFLIGGAYRNMYGQDTEIKRNYMNCLIALLEGDTNKAKSFVKEQVADPIEEMDIATLSDAVNAWHGLGDDCRASEMLHEMETKLNSLPDENEKTVSALMMVKNEETLGDKKQRSMAFNKKGLALYVEHKFSDAIDLFYQAYILFPQEPAFSLNLLQSMVEAGIVTHKKADIATLNTYLGQQKLSSANAARMRDINTKIKQMNTSENAPGMTQLH